MALTAPRGFSGGPMADIDYGIGAAGTPWVESVAALAVTQPNTGTRTVSLAAGTADAFGVRVTNDAPLPQALAAPSSGGAWYLIALRFNWSAKTCTLQVLPGPTTGTTAAPTAIPAALPGTVTSTPGASFDMPLAWVFVNSADTIATVFDTRMGRSLGQPVAIGGAALGVLALQQPPQVGTMVANLPDGITFRWDAVPLSNPIAYTWRPWESSWSAYDAAPSGIKGAKDASPGWVVLESSRRFRGGRVMLRGYLYINGGTGGLAQQAYLGLPFPMSLPAGAKLTGSAGAFRGGTEWEMALLPTNANQCSFGPRNASGQITPNSPTVPITWAQGDGLGWSIEYDAA